ARRQPDLRFAFSRPGFVTFRVADDAAGDSSPTLRSPFARTWGHSLGKVTGADTAELVRKVWVSAASLNGRSGSAQIQHLHVWQPDGALPGDEGCDATAEPPAQAAGAQLLAGRPDSTTSLSLNTEVRAGESVLDCVLVEPLEWWIGWHRAESP